MTKRKLMATKTKKPSKPICQCPGLHSSRRTPDMCGNTANLKHGRIADKILWLCPRCLKWAKTRSP